LRSLTAHHGKPKTIYSDNGTNFQGTLHQVHEVYNTLQSSAQIENTQNFLPCEGCEWKFIPRMDSSSMAYGKRL